MKKHHQLSFSELEYAHKRKRTRRDKFFEELDAIIPWDKLLLALQPYYYCGKRGRAPIGLEIMLRMYIAQNSLALSDEGIEDAIYDSQAVRRFVGIDIGSMRAPDSTTLEDFRHLLQANNAMSCIMDTINEHLQVHGMLLRRGTVVDATIIAAPSSTKNQTKQRDSEMRSTRKGNTWYFGMKAHIGVDAHSGVVHSLTCTAANEHDVSQAHTLLHGQEEQVIGDAGYQGADKRVENQNRKNTAGKAVQWSIAMRPGKRRALDKSTHAGQLQEQLERVKARMRAKVEHPFHIIKNRLKHKKARYKGLRKNRQQLQTLFALANLLICKNTLKASAIPQGLGASAIQAMG